MKASLYEGNKTMTTVDSSTVVPGAGEVRIDVAWCGVCGTDLHIYLGHMDARVANPQIMGHEMSGTIAELGEGVDGWSVGDRVVVRPLDPCGACPACAAGHAHICQNLKFLGIDTQGAFQSSWTVPAHTLHRLPDSIGLDIGALIEPLSVACHDVRLGEIAEGEQVVVLGGGPIGTLVALVAREAGGNVIISEVNPFRIEFARSLGFDAVNPLEVDLPALVMERTNGAGAHVVFEVTGIAAGAEMMAKLPRTRGRIVIVGIHAEPAPVDLFQFFWREIRLCGARVYEPQDYEKAIVLAAEGKLPLHKIVTARKPLSELGAAIEELIAGGAAMKTLVNCD